MILIPINIFEIIARQFPNLKISLRKAGIGQRPKDFIKKSIMSSFYMTIGVMAFVFLVLSKMISVTMIIIVFTPILFVILFFYMIKMPEAKISKREKDISREIVFAGRHLIIELESGIPLYNAFINLSKNYKAVGRYFKEIVDKVNLGTSMEDAINETIELTPSTDFRRVLWQLLNSMRTGSDVTKSLNAVIEQIVREQIIEVNKYGRKLNPLAMFYMILSVIMPSLGVTMLIIMSSFVEFRLSLSILIFMAFMLGFLQFMFLSIIKFSRPAIDI